MLNFTQKKYQYEKNFSHIKKKKYKKNIKIKLIILPVCLLFIAGVFCIRSFYILFVILISNLKNKGGIKNDEKN